MAKSNSKLCEQLQRMLLAKPFSPFAIETTDGRRFRFIRKFQAAMNELILIYMAPNEAGITVIQLNEVKSIIPA
ncbi:MAG TPA: hypothetical protein VGG19_17440 [Tepidisphaeraceae bacterium]|jgi:hypothetical protein